MEDSQKYYYGPHTFTCMITVTGFWHALSAKYSMANSMQGSKNFKQVAFQVVLVRGTFFARSSA